MIDRSTGRFASVRLETGPCLHYGEFGNHDGAPFVFRAESLKLPPRLWRLTIDRLLEYDDTEQLAQIESPTMLLWGDRDALFSRAEQDRFLAALPSAQLTVYEETGHCPNWEQPERVAADISAFALRH